MPVVSQESGESWVLYHGDTCTVLPDLPSCSVHLSVHSPPFSSLYTYTNLPQDLGNSRSDQEFFAHYAYVIHELLRVTVPGRLACVHVQQLTTTKTTHGYMGMKDFRGDVIRAYQSASWIYHGEVTIDKDPQSVACRTKKTSLMFVTKRRDSTVLSPVFADYVLIFRKPGDNPAPVQHSPNGEVTDEDWILWARPIWYGIEETHVLNVSTARDNDDERHLCPLSLDTIERCVKLWSNQGETVLDPFSGVGSTGVVAVQTGRRYVGIELKESYFRSAVTFLRQAEAEVRTPTLFDEVAIG